MNSQPPDNILLSAALDYAGRGWQVIPLHSIRDGRCTCGKSACKSRGKHPRTLHGLSDASTDPELIRRWWKQWPDANVGIVTGAGSGLIGLDVDPRHGGDESLADLEVQHGRLPATVESLTGGGGRHVLFNHPGGYIRGDNRGKIGRGLDLKADGGYLVAPPSLHMSGRTYEWELSSAPGAVKLADPPVWLRAKLNGTKAAASGKVQPATNGAINNGQRNDTLTSLAGAMRRQGVDHDGILAVLLTENSRRCVPPLDRAEVEGIAKSINRYPPAEEGDEKPSQAEGLVRLALERYRFGRTEADEPFAVERNGPNVALMFRGSRDALRASLAREFRRKTGRTPNASALADALNVLQGEALTAEPEAVALRVADHDGGVVIDLANGEGRAVVVRPAGWEVVSSSPVLFRQTALTGILPVPVHGGSLNDLRPLLNVTAESWPLVKGWALAALIPSIPHPILMLGGEQGSGKSVTARMLVGLIDPSPALLRSEPRNGEAWAVAAAGSWVVAVDNVSRIPSWWSDALCKVVTGDGWITRRLYTDSDVAVLSFRRVVALTSIDAGALRGDLGDRLLLVDLEPIPADRRRTEGEIDAAYAALRPRIFGGLLDILAAVLAVLPKIELRSMPRMADFARVLAALDQVEGNAGRSLTLYRGQGGRIAGEVVDSDPVASAIVELVERYETWKGTAGELLKAIEPDIPPRGWPESARAMAGQLRRLIPALRGVGVEVDYERAGRQRRRQYTVGKTAQSTVHSVRTDDQDIDQRVIEVVREQCAADGADGADGF